MSASSSFFATAVVLGLLSAVGPFAIDMYLPALPAIGLDLGADSGRVQLTLTTYLLAVAIGQLLYGPVSDMVGRKRPLYVGLALFTVASIGCALATSLPVLIACRFLQGLAAAAAMSIPRAVVRDLHTGPEAARLMSLLLLVFSVSPILAPLVGSGLIAIGSWRTVFWMVAASALAAIALVAFALPETRPAHLRLDSSVASALRSYRTLLRDRHYLGLVAIGAFGLLGFFIYLSGSAFVLIEHYGLSPTGFSVAFGLNAAAFFGTAQWNGRLSRRHGLETLVRVGVSGSAVVLTVLVGWHLLARAQLVVDHLAVLLVLNFLSTAFMALAIPTSSVLALDRHGPIAGTASALLGTLQMLFGAIGMAVVAPFSDGQPLPMVIGMACGVFLALIQVALTLGFRPGPLPSQASEAGKARQA